MTCRACRALRACELAAFWCRPDVARLPVWFDGPCVCPGCVRREVDRLAAGTWLVEGIADATLA